MNFTQSRRTLPFIMGVIACLVYSMIIDPGVHSASISPGYGNRKDPFPKYVSCYRQNIYPMLELLPNWYNCSTYFHCEVQIVDGKPGPAAVIKHCPQGHDGILYYDFQSCECKEKENAECYDEYNPDHRKNYWTCTQPWDGTA